MFWYVSLFWLVKRICGLFLCFILCRRFARNVYGRSDNLLTLAFMAFQVFICSCFFFVLPHFSVGRLRSIKGVILVQLFLLAPVFRLSLLLPLVFNVLSIVFVFYCIWSIFGFLIQLRGSALCLVLLFLF